MKDFLGAKVFGMEGQRKTWWGEKTSAVLKKYTAVLKKYIAEDFQAKDFRFFKKKRKSFAG
jgi:hypothetical protein